MGRSCSCFTFFILHFSFAKHLYMRKGYKWRIRKNCTYTLIHNVFIINTLGILFTGI